VSEIGRSPPVRFKVARAGNSRRSRGNAPMRTCRDSGRSDSADRVESVVDHSVLCLAALRVRDPVFMPSPLRAAALRNGRSGVLLSRQTRSPGQGARGIALLRTSAHP